MNEKIFYLTEQGVKKIKEEYQNLWELKKVKMRLDVPPILHSEELDTEFVSYKEDMELLESRLEELDYILKHFKLITPPKEEKDRINIGSKVLLEVEGEKDELEIVGTIEANPALGKVSNESPVGKALLGHKQGDIVVIHATTKIAYKIIKVSY